MTLIYCNGKGERSPVYRLLSEQMKSTRERILQTLLNNPKSTINELAETVGINAISVRHHLNSMLAEGLVTLEEERHGVGRPRLIYSLTDRGLERFPTRYFRLTNRLLDQLEGALPAAEIEKLFASMAREMAEEHARQTKNLSIEEKLNFLKKLLADEGFIVEWEKIGDNYHIREITCPYFQVGQEHPQVCLVDQTLISTVLSIPTQKISCVLQGDHLCTYVVPVDKKMEMANE